MFRRYLARTPSCVTVPRVLANVVTSIPHACAAVGLPEPFTVEGPAPTPRLTALVPIQEPSRCLYVVVHSDAPEALALAAGATEAEAADILGEIANMVAGIVVAGTEYTLGLPVVFDSAPLVAPPSEVRVFEAGGARFCAGLLG